MSAVPMPMAAPTVPMPPVPQPPPNYQQYYPPAATASPGLPQKMVNWVAVNASTATIIIVILVILCVGMAFYYRGVFGFGPFNDSTPSSKKKKSSKSSSNANDDPATLDLIDQVNS